MSKIGIWCKEIKVVCLVFFNNIVICCFSLFSFIIVINCVEKGLDLDEVFLGKKS